jgi:hypothetical protein
MKNRRSAEALAFSGQLSPCPGEKPYPGLIAHGFGAGLSTKLWFFPI